MYYDAAAEVLELKERWIRIQDGVGCLRSHLSCPRFQSHASWRGLDNDGWVDEGAYHLQRDVYLFSIHGQTFNLDELFK